MTSMKTSKTFALTLMAAALATGGFAQGKGGGGSRGGGAAVGVGHALPSETPARSAPHEQKPGADAPRSAAPAAQDYAAGLHDINQTAFNDRRQLVDSVDMSLKSSHDALKQIQATAKASRMDAHSDFKAALHDVKAREKELDSAAKAMKKADEANWAARRDALANAYQNHADAMARLEAIVRAP